MFGNGASPCLGHGRCPCFPIGKAKVDNAVDNGARVFFRFAGKSAAAARRYGVYNRLTIAIRFPIVRKKAAAIKPVVKTSN